MDDYNDINEEEALQAFQIIDEDEIDLEPIEEFFSFNDSDDHEELEFSWDDLDDFDDIDDNENLNEHCPSNIEVNGKLTRWERARQIAADVIHAYDWGMKIYRYYNKYFSKMVGLRLEFQLNGN